MNIYGQNVSYFYNCFGSCDFDFAMYSFIYLKPTKMLFCCVLCPDVLVEDSPAPCQILHLLEEGGPRPLTFVLNANLLVNVKLVTCE